MQRTESTERRYHPDRIDHKGATTPTSNTRPCSADRIADTDRIVIFDLIRGLVVISMILFHLCYDLVMLFGVDVPWFYGPVQILWRCSISWTFIALAGCMVCFSKNNVLRSLRLLALALFIFLVTSWAKIDDPINFGIIFCLGACTAITEALRRIGFRIEGYRYAVGLLVSFFVCLPISSGSVFLGITSLSLPPELYQNDALAWLGFVSPQFVSGDYYPVLPHLFLYLAAYAWCARVQQQGFPLWSKQPVSSFAKPLRLVACSLQSIGQHALGIYLLHQGVLLCILKLFLG